MRKPVSLLIATGLVAAVASTLSLAADRENGHGLFGERDGSRGCASGTASRSLNVGGLLELELDLRRRGRSLQVVGLTDDQRLVCFDEFKPERARDIGYVSGLHTDTSLVGIDFRVQDGKLYGVGNAGGVYMLDVSNAVATLVNRLTVALDGRSFGVDFNPAADRLRVVSDTGQNLRHNVNAGGTTLSDDALDYAPGAPLNAIGPTAQGIVGSAYTNNDLSPLTSTTLYAFDANLDQIAIQSPPNNGSLAATGKLSVDAGAASGFDIYSIVRDDVSVDVRALASITTDGRAGLYGVTLATGKAVSRGHFRSRDQVTDIAVPLNQL